MSVRVLIACPSPRDLKPWKDGIDSVKGIPKLLVKYYKELEAYTIMRDYFLDHKDKYDYLCIIPDDLIVTQEGFNKLLQDIEELNNPPVFSGICNYGLVPGEETRLAICIDKIPHPQLRGRVYAWADLRNKDHPVPTGIIKVMFAGFPCMFIRKDILEEIPLNGDIEWNVERLPSTDSQSFDLAFCHECKERGIPIMVDTRVLFIHMKSCNPHIFKCDPEKILVGKKEYPPKIIYVDETGREEDITEKLPKVYRQTEDWYRKIIKA